LVTMVALITMVTSDKDGMWCDRGNPTKLHKYLKPLLGKAHLTNLNLSHFELVEAMGLKIIALRYTWMISAAYQISWKSTNRFKRY
jgi:hypothetical protein